MFIPLSTRKLQYMLNVLQPFFCSKEEHRMRRNIVSDGAGQLKYEIREIVEVAKHLSAMGLEITFENIGDPVEKVKSYQSGSRKRSWTWLQTIRATATWTPRDFRKHESFLPVSSMTGAVARSPWRT